MHIFFSGVGGTGIGPLALIAKQAGYEVSGSDKQDSQYTQYLKSKGLKIQIGQGTSGIEAVHEASPIDWFVYSSALPMENPDHPELKFCEDHKIKMSKRDEFLNQILSDKKLKLLAIAGTHGKTTTTAMLIWLFKQIKIPISYSVGAKISFGEMGQYDASSEYFVYEADEFDRNFLSFTPYTSLITGVDYDHPDIYPTRQEYYQAFCDFVAKSKLTILWQSDFKRLELANNENFNILNDDETMLNSIKLVGQVNRRDAWQVIQAVHQLTDTSVDELTGFMNDFPGLSRRFEQIAPNIYSDYAHTPEKIKGALETAQEVNKNVVVVYEGLHNTRQHFIKEELKHLFDDVRKLYIVPSYLAREDESLEMLTPEKLVALTSQPEKARAMQLDADLEQSIKQHAEEGDLVICLTAGGGGSLDEWLRTKFIT